MTCSRLTAFVLLALTASALAGGAGGPPAAAPAPAVLGRALASAQARWKATGLRAYSFDFEQIAQPVRYPKTRITVSAGQVSARPVEEGDASDGHPLSFDSQLQTPGTVNGMADGGASWTASDFKKR